MQAATGRYLILALLAAPLLTACDAGGKMAGVPNGNCAFAGLPADQCNPWLPPAAVGRQWHLSFSEEFSGNDYDSTKLTPCFDWNYGGCTSSFNQGREHYEASQIQVSNGAAKLVAQPTTPSITSNACQNNQCTYLSGLLSTARPHAGDGSDYLFAFTYGYVEARLKLVATQGFFTAFWMLPTDTNYVYRSEIDILEHLGHDPVTMFMTYHYQDRNSSFAVNSGVGNNGTCPALDYGTDFHRFAVDWQRDHVAWYIDGIKCGQFDGDEATIANGPMQIILDLMVDNTWQRSWNVGLLDSTLSRHLDVDYIRVFQQR
ncbi:MAG: glycoside hydrolase family 16 protein [Gemmatimonadota bacterium]